MFRHCVPLLLAVAFLAAGLAPASAHQRHGASALYQADSANGWAGWVARGWAVHGGALESTGQNGATEIRAPYVPGRHHINDYTVDATIELLSSTSTPYRGVEVRRSAARGYRFYSCCAEGNQIGVDALVQHETMAGRTAVWKPIALGSQPELNTDMEYQVMLHGRTLYANAYGPGGSDFATARHLTDTRGGWAGLYAGAGTQIRVTCFAVTTWRNAIRPCGDQFAATGTVTNAATATFRKPKLSLLAPTTAQAQSLVDVFVHTAPRVAVHLRAQFAGETYRAAQFTGARGRTRFVYDIPFSAQPGTASITARTTIRGHRLSATRTVQVEPFVPDIKVGAIAILHQTRAGWAQTTEVHTGETVHLAASYAVRELAGYYSPPCSSLSGTVQILRGRDVLLSVPIWCPAAEPADVQPYAQADVTLTHAIGVGSLTVQFDLSHDEGMYGVAHGEASAALSVLP